MRSNTTIVMPKRIIWCPVTKNQKLSPTIKRWISIIKRNSNLKIRNSQLSKRQLFIIGENSRLILMFRLRMEVIILKCIRTRLNSIRKKMKNRNWMKGKRDGRITIIRNLRTQIEIRIRKLERIKELRAIISMGRKRMLMICLMKQKRMIRSIFNIFKVRISNIQTKERKMS